VKCVFADAWFYIALVDADDQGHQRAAAWLRDYDGNIVTTRSVLTEAANSLSTPALRGTMTPFLRSLENQPEVRIVGDGDVLYHRGLALYGARPDKEWSPTDCISFVVMADEGLTEALTGDHHFEQAGFRALLRSA
jgi:predicted nucleic acid-binding protein